MISNPHNTNEINAAIALQLFYRGIIKAKRKAKIQSLGLDIAPNIPQKALLASTEHREKFLALYAENYRAWGRMQLKNLKYISFDQLIVKLRECTEQYLKIIRQAPKKKTLLLIHKGHSQHWVASLSLKYFATNYMPDYSYDTNDKFFKSLTIPNDIERIVMFDDWSISGTQANDILKNVTRTIENTPNKNIEIVFIIPFITSAAKKSLLSTNSKITIITAEILLQQNDIPELVQAVKNCSVQGMNTHGCLIYSDWKIPDGMSSPRCFVDGHPSIWHMDPAIAMQPSRSPIPCHPIITDINEPYKSKSMTSSSKTVCKYGY